MLHRNAAFLGALLSMIWLARLGPRLRKLCAGCGTQLFPDAGPNALAVKSGVTWNGPPYGLVKLSPKVVNILNGVRAAHPLGTVRRPSSAA